MSSLDDNGEIIKQTLKSELGKIEGIDKITDKTNGIQVEYKGKSQFIPTGNGKIELGEDELEDIADGIIEEQEEQDYVIGIDVYGNQVDLANWDYVFHNADLLLMYTGKIENGTMNNNRRNSSIYNKIRKWNSNKRSSNSIRRNI